MLPIHRFAENRIRGVYSPCTQGVVNGNTLILTEDLPALGTAGGCGVHAEDGIKGRHREVGMEAKRHIPLLGAGDRIHAQRTFADEHVTVQIAPYMHVPDKKVGNNAELRHAVKLFL
mgnify:CR=1 FL=1